MENQPVVVTYPRVPITAGSDVQIHTINDLKRAEVQGEPVSISQEQLIRTIDKAVKAVEGTPTILDFSIHESTKQIMVKVIERDTGKVIREIPPEKMLDFVAKLCQMAGIIVDEKL